MPSTDPSGADSPNRTGPPSAGADETGAEWTTAQGYSAVPLPDQPGTGYRGIPPSVLDNVFDDPRHGDPGRDRLGVHLCWEMLLLSAVALLAYLLHREDPGAMRGESLRSLLVCAVALGLLALGAGLSLRTGAPNLAIGPVAVGSAQYFSEQGSADILAVLGPVTIAAAAVGLLLALVVVGFHVPAWAASLAAAMAIMAVVGHRSAPLDPQPWYDPTRHADYLFVGYTAVALLGGVFGTVKAIRRALGRFRPVADPARRRGGVAATITALAIVTSTVFAMLAGVLLAAPVSPPAEPDSGFAWTGLALGAALLGGTSAFGRRGGIFGTLFAVLLFTLLLRYVDERSWQVSHLAVAAAAIAVGLVVTRLVETYGRSRAAMEAENDWAEESGDRPDADWLFPSGRSEPWRELPAGRAEPWDTDRWGAAGR